MNILDIEKLPYSEFGTGKKRKIRLVVSPDTTGEDKVVIVHVTVPPGGISEGHIHTDCDEYIYFEGDGAVILNSERSEVKKGSLIHAVKGLMHECINTSPDKNLILLCIFVPPFKPYGPYPELINKTKHFLK